VYGPTLRTEKERLLSLNEKIGRNVFKVICWMWEHRADTNEAEGCCIERATASDYNLYTIR